MTLTDLLRRPVPAPVEPRPAFGPIAVAPRIRVGWSPGPPAEGMPIHASTSGLRVPCGIGVHRLSQRDLSDPFTVAMHPVWCAGCWPQAHLYCQVCGWPLDLTGLDGQAVGDECRLCFTAGLDEEKRRECAA